MQMGLVAISAIGLGEDELAFPREVFIGYGRFLEDIAAVAYCELPEERTVAACRHKSLRIIIGREAAGAEPGN